MRNKILKDYRKKEYELSTKLFDECLKVQKFEWINTKQKKGFSLFRKKKTPYTAGTYVQSFAKNYKKELAEFISTFKTLHENVAVNFLNWKDFHDYIPNAESDFINSPGFKERYNPKGYSGEFDDLCFDVLMSLDKSKWNPDFVPLYVHYDLEPYEEDDGIIYFVLMDLETAVIDIQRVNIFIIHDPLSCCDEVAS